MPEHVLPPCAHKNGYAKPIINNSHINKWQCIWVVGAFADAFRVPCGLFMLVIPALLAATVVVAP
jgi:hypothetical protein